MVRWQIALFAAILAVVGCSREPSPGTLPHKGEGTALDHARFLAHVQALAGDEFEGRAPASPAESKTIEYIAREFKAAGLQPANGDSYFQTVPMVEITADPNVGFTVNKAGQSRQYKYGEDVMVWTKRVQPEVSLAASEMVFVGYGIVAPEYQWDDYAGVDMRGKTAVILINDPGFVTGDPQLFAGKAMTYHGRWTYKFEEAARQGAAGAIIVHETAPASYGWEVVRSSWSGPQLDSWTEDGNAKRVAIEGWVSHDAARSLFELAGLDLASLQRSAHQHGFKPVSMGLKLAASVRNTIRRSQSSNVAGVLPGRKRKDEYVLYMAHWDHLGRDPQLKGDTIYNGAIDNATGISGLILMAQAFADAQPAPERSIVFLATTGEESGLLGSAHYAQNPLFPLATTAAVINMDALYEGGPTREVSVIGYGASELEDLLRAAAQEQQRRLEPDPVPERGSFYRSDHFNLAKQGVPALYIKPGIDAVQGGVQVGKALHEDYATHRYHQVSDEYRPDMEFHGAVQDLELLYLVGYRVAQSSSWPNWYPGNEFRAVRDRTAAARR